MQLMKNGSIAPYIPRIKRRYAVSLSLSIIEAVVTNGLTFARHSFTAISMSLMDVTKMVVDTA